MILDSSGNRRFYGVYRGTVTDSKDPDNKRRIKATVPQVLGTEPTDWAWPVDSSTTHPEPPKVGQGVWVIFEGGDPSFPIWSGTFGLYKGTGSQVEITDLPNASYPETIADNVSEGKFDVISSVVDISSAVETLSDALDAEIAESDFPTGGLEGQILSKLSDDDYDTTWIDNYAGELRIIVKNDTGVTINKGQAVMAVGSVGDRIRVARANADGSISARFMLGVASENITNGNEGYINLLGEIRQLNTSAYTVGTVLYIDPASPGALTSTEPVSPQLDMSVAIVTRQHATTGIIFVRMWNQGVDLREVNDVKITSPSTGDLLSYNSTSGIWENSPKPSGNAIINGAFDIWQKGVSFNSQSVLSAGYTADRWHFYRTSGLSGATLTRQSITFPGFQYAARVQRNSGETSTTTTYLRHTLETTDSIPFQSKRFTLSFYARRGANFSPSGNSLVISISRGTSVDRASYNFDNFSSVILTSRVLGTEFERYTVTGTFPSGITGVGVEFIHAATGTAGANDWFEITGVQLEEGAITTPFKRNAPSIQAELAACQRYFVSFNNEGTTDTAHFISSIGAVNTTTTARFSIPLPVTMRIAPTSLSFTQGTGVNIFLFDLVNSTAYAAFPDQTIVLLSTFSTRNFAGVQFNLTGSPVLTVGRPVALLTNGSSRIALDLNAELQ